MNDNLTYRYELKFAIDNSKAFTIENVLQLHPHNFKKAFPDRIINNIYFDNINYQGCQENLDGISERTKIRYRWYGTDHQFDSGKIELKIKKNALGTKLFYEVDHPININDLTHKTRSTLNKYNIFPTLHNQYLRSYYLDQSKDFRLTIDRDISFWQPHFKTVIPSVSDSRTIVEVKFDQSKALAVDKITKYLPFRLTKHSKYATGILGLMV